ncbi:conserved exported hypothetical protein [Candidatus Sulfopaludibacter sp. SbA4]|nr:conserved exported hypothetical protein [Candidatus Sulfopaludibacter sp. SbA4]
MRIAARLVIGLTVTALAGLFGQAASGPPAFEVASLKPANPQDSVIGLFTYPGGRITVTLYTLEMLLEEAFDIQAFQLSGGPRWMHDDRYDIVAKPPASSKSGKANPPYPKAPPNDEQRQMLQTLLVDRFQLKFHRETREGPVYLLLKGNNQLNLQDARNKDDYPWAGSLGGGAISGNGIAGTNISMPLLATRLSRYLERPVLDQTGLKGSFDFKVAYQSDDPHPDIVSSILTSVQGLGLKLEAARGPVETIVIDHAEKPSGN